MNGRWRGVGLVLVSLGVLAVFVVPTGGPVWAVETAGSTARDADIARAPTDTGDKPDPDPSPEPSPSPTPEPSPSPSPEPSPEPSPSPTTEPSPVPSPTTTPPPKGDPPPPPPTGSGSTQPGPGTGGSTGTTTPGVFVGTTSRELLPKLQDHATDGPRPIRKKKPKEEIEAVDAGSLWGSEDAWIDSVSSIIAGLASVGTGTTTGSAACSVGGCPPPSDGLGAGLVIVLGAFMAGALAIASRLTRRRLKGSPGR